ncbi:MAG: succinylglutamate desuccinylase/aspartoacylase family protein [Phycisphaerales bacterium JB038]
MAPKPDASDWFGESVPPGDRVATSLVITESYAGADISIPVFLWRGPQEGPTVFISAAVHGDEINGTGAIRRIIREQPFELQRGTLVLVPVVNILGFERHTRYTPDRRDMNRSFPGSREGSLTARMTWLFFKQIVARCDYGIDLHTAAVRRTNFPNVRADMTNEKLAPFARAFGAELIVSGAGPKGSLRTAACAAGCATLILEAGEVWKVEPGVVEYALRGITNCLRHLGMVDGELIEPPYRIETDASKWLRASHGGFLEFHIAPGDIVHEGDPIATNTDLTGEEQNILHAPRDGVVLGMTTIPSVAPGDPVCNLAFPRKGALKRVGRTVNRLGSDSLHERMREYLAINILVTDPDADDA